jgi:hypothetical protein
MTARERDAQVGSSGQRPLQFWLQILRTHRREARKMFLSSSAIPLTSFGAANFIRVWLMRCVTCFSPVLLRLTGSILSTHLEGAWTGGASH